MNIKRGILAAFLMVAIAGQAAFGQEIVKLGTATNPLCFFMVASSDHVTGKTGAAPVVTIRKSNASAAGTFVTPTGSITEIGNGWYQVNGNGTDTNTVGPLLLHATGTLADPIDVKYLVISAFDPQIAGGSAGGLLIDGVNAGVVTFSDRIVVTSGTSGQPAVLFTGLGTNGEGLRVSGGAGSANGISSYGGAGGGNGINGVALAGNGAGISGAGFGSGQGFYGAGGATGEGAKFLGGGTSGDGIYALGQGTTVGGSGIHAAGVGATKHGIFAAGDASNGTLSDGIKVNAGIGGVAVRADTISTAMNQLLRDAMKLAPSAGAPQGSSIDAVLATLETHTQAVADIEAGWIAHTAGAPDLTPAITAGVDFLTMVTPSGPNFKFTVDAVSNVTGGTGGTVTIDPQGVRDAMALALTGGTSIVVGSIDDKLATGGSGGGVTKQQVRDAMKLAPDPLTPPAVPGSIDSMILTGPTGLYGDVNMEPIPAGRLWKMIATQSGGLQGGRTLSVKSGATPAPTFGFDFSADLPANGYIASVGTPTINTGPANGLTFGASGRDHALAKVPITPSTAGAYTINIPVTYNTGATATGTVSLTVSP